MDQWPSVFKCTMISCNTRYAQHVNITITVYVLWDISHEVSGSRFRNLHLWREKGLPIKFNCRKCLYKYEALCNVNV